MKIFSVNQVSVHKITDSPLALYIEAHGFAATGGWTNPRLEPVPEPEDGILEFNFEADRPKGPVPQHVTPIQASTTVKPKTQVDAVTVVARTNEITVHVSQFVPLNEPATGAGTARGITTFIVGEEVHPTTLIFGEEHHVTTFIVGEETHPTTLRIGEEITTNFVAEGPPPQQGPHFGPIDPGPLRPGPFGGF